jgi:hypothetical protein
MHQPNPNKTSPMASCTHSHSTGCPSQTTDAAKPTEKPTSTQLSCPTTRNPPYCTTCPQESNQAAGLMANLSAAVHPPEHTRVADFAADVSESTLVADFSAKSNLETTSATVVVAGRNITPCRDAIAIPPPDQEPFCLPNPFEVDNASNMSLRSKSANVGNNSQPLLTPNNNTQFNDDNVALAGGKDESVDDDNVAHATGLGENMALSGGQEVNAPVDNDVAPPGRHNHTAVFDGSPGDSPLHATQASLVDPRQAPPATISPDDIFHCLCQILTKLDNKVDASTLTTSIQQMITTSIEKALDGLLSPLRGRIKTLKAHLKSSKDNTATLALTLRSELRSTAEPIYTELNTLQQCVTDDIIALNAHIKDITTTPPHIADTIH